MKTSKRVIRVTKSDRAKLDDIVAIEASYKFYINRKMVYEFLCSPSDIEELLIGYLYINRYINSIEDITKISIQDDKIDAHIVSQEILDLKPSQTDISISTTTIWNAMDKLDNSGKTFKSTGGTHIAGLFQHNKILFNFEDISRHNAVLKVVGRGVQEHVNFSGCAILLSCRITSSIIDLLAPLPLHIICSQSAVTDLAIEKAERTGKSVTGFVRDGRMNLYTGIQRFI